LVEAAPEKFGGIGKIKPRPIPLAVDELLATVAQPPELPLTLDDAPPSLVEELLLQLYAIAAFWVGFRTKNVPATEIAIAIVQNTLYILNYIRRVDKKTLEPILRNLL
jgi:hypothetical protein